jgi:ribose/xylose/arabinose/galactoside ABC-type transport system permease subunit
MADTAVRDRRGVTPERRERWRRWLRDRGVYVALVAVILFNVAFTTNFAAVATARNLLTQVAPVLLVSLGMALVIGTRGIDLSVGAVMAIAAAVVPLYLGYGWTPAIVMAVAAGMAAGVLNGGLVAVLQIQPIVATLALLVGGRGLAQVLIGGRLQIISDPGILAIGRARVAGIPVPVIIAAVAVAVIGLVVRRTTFGRYVLAIGSNPAASELAGHPVRRVLVGTYAISGGLAALAGVIVAARLAASDPGKIGVLMELDAIAAVVVGGTPLAGGRVRIAGTVAGALLMMLITATFIMNNLPFTSAQMLKAIIIVAAVMLQRGARS